MPHDTVKLKEVQTINVVGEQVAICKGKLAILCYKPHREILKDKVLFHVGHVLSHNEDKVLICSDKKVPKNPNFNQFRGPNTEEIVIDRITTLETVENILAFRGDTIRCYMFQSAYWNEEPYYNGTKGKQFICNEGGDTAIAYSAMQALAVLVHEQKKLGRLYLQYFSDKPIKIPGVFEE